MHKLLSFILLSSKMSSRTSERSKRSTLLKTLKMGSAKLRLFTWRMVEMSISLSGMVFEIFGMRWRLTSIVSFKSKIAHSLITSPNEFRIVTRDVGKRTVFITLSALKCPVVDCLVDSFLLKIFVEVLIRELFLRSMKQCVIFHFALAAGWT